MDYEACNVVYVDRAAPEDKLVKREDLISSALVYSPLDHVDEHVPVPGRVALNDNLQTLLGMFNEGLSRPSLAREEA
jgi:3',5'-cyclic-nucleotide phosphodiesterase